MKNEEMESLEFGVVSNRERDRDRDRDRDRERDRNDIAERADVVLDETQGSVFNF